MNLRATLLGTALWLTLLGIGAKWVTNPILKPPAPNVTRITAAETATAFPIRVVSLTDTQTIAGDHDQPFEKSGELKASGPPPKFSYENWSFRESRKRAIVFFLVWMASGLAIHWLVGRTPRKKQ